MNTLNKNCDPCSQESIGSNKLKYEGPRLPCTNVKNLDSLTVVLQKIDEQICNMNTVINSLTTTTTTTTARPTTTTTSTTSTTTTSRPSYPFVMRVSKISAEDACSNGMIGIYYSTSPMLLVSGGLAINPQLTQAASDGFYCLVEGCPNSSGVRWIRLISGNGTINQVGFC